MKKLQVLSAIAVLSLSSLVGCSGDKGESEPVDKTKAQLTISTFEGGVGKKWLENAAREFEEMNKDRTDYKEGRTGIQIHIKMDRSVGGASLETSNFNRDIYFTENVDYYKLTNQNKLLDISDILKAENPDDGGKRIIDKIDNNLLSFMTRNNKIYAVPFYECIYGLVYDKALFEDQGYYLTDDGEPAYSKEQYGTGPNGIAGDWDDGLPKTYAQFETLMELMVENDDTPFTYSKNNSKEYTTRALVSWWSDYEGYDQTQLNFSFNGTAEHLVSSISGREATLAAPKTITKNNGYELRKQAGVFYALDFARNVLTKKTSYYSSKPSSNYDAQKLFVRQKYTDDSNKAIGMLFEGTWWENEAKSVFEDLINNNGVDPSEFRFGLMPIPKVDEDHLGDATFTNLNRSYGFINAKTTNKMQALEFFKFLHTDAQLKAFTLETNMTRGLDYSFTEEEFAQVSDFAKDLMYIKQSEHAKLIYPYSDQAFFINNASTFNTTEWVFSTKAYTSDPIIKFISNRSLTAAQYFNDHKNAITSTDWSLIIG